MPPTLPGRLGLYDIAEDKCRTEVFKYLRRWGDHLQYPVFRCKVGSTDRAEMVAELRQLINHDTDQILFFDLGPADGRAGESVVSLGMQYTHPERHVIVI